MKHKVATVIILGSLIASFTLAISSGLYTSNNPCSDCHRVWFEHCNLLPNDYGSYLPEVINGGNTTVRLSAEVIGSGRNRYYEIDRLSMSLTSANGLVEFPQSIKEYRSLYPGDKIVAEFDILGKKDGIDTFHFTLSAYNSHENSRFQDSYSYQVTVDTANDSNETLPAVEPSSWSILLGNADTILYLYINRDVHTLQLSGPENINIQPSYITNSSAGKDIAISINTSSENRIEGTINISWIDEGAEDFLLILSIYNPPFNEQVNYFSLSGRILGIVCFMLLVLSMMMGGITRSISRFFSVKIGNTGRVKLHCYLSYLLLTLAILHGFILVIKPYNEFFYDPKILLGNISALFMLIVSINGSFMKPLVRLFGAKAWRWTHRVFSWSAVAITLIHAISIGTDFAFIREVLNL